jgi:hypothetical protein
MVPQNSTTQTDKYFVPHFDKVSPFGNIPYLFSLVVSFGFIGLTILLFFQVDKAKHLVFYDFDKVDPFFSTYLIFIYGFLSSALFVYQILTDPQYDDKNRKAESSIPRVFYLFNGILAVLPSGYWLLLLIFNSPEKHIYSIIISLMMVLYLATIYFNVDYRLRKIKKAESIFKIVIDKTQFSAIFVFLAFIITVIFIYLLFKYETSYLNGFTSKMDEFNKTTNWIKHLYFIFGIILVSGFYQLWVVVKEKFGWWYYLLAIMIVIICISLISIGTIHALDVILLYIIILRWLLFEIGEVLKVMYKIFFVYGIKNFINDKNLKFTPREYFSFGFLVFAILILTIQMSSDNQQNYISQYDFKLQNITPKNTVTLTSAFENWINERKDNGKDIYIISGQGGGSRAGCTMYATLAKLESMDRIRDNILAITTISGSSNGALFYLGAKYLNHPMQNLKNDADTLYNVDYVSTSLFKLLFTDRLLYSVINKKYFINRNDSHIQLESNAFRPLSKSTNPDILKSMQWHDWYKDSIPSLPIFLPITYNVSVGKPAVSSPYTNDVYNPSNYYPILDSLKQKNKTISISQSVALSQMFPVISASGLVNGHNYMDGGVYDNGPFESLEEIYHAVRAIRDKLGSTKKIIMISVENGQFEIKPDISTTQITSTIAAATRSIFTSNPLTHLNEIRSNMSKKDTIINLKIYPNPSPPEKLKWYQLNKYLKIKINDSYVVMSRYLTRSEIETILDCSEDKIKENFEQNGELKFK